MEKIEKFVNELKETLNYSRKTEVTYEKWGEKLYKVKIYNINILFTDTLKVLVKWNVQEIYKNIENYYEIIIGF